MANPATAAAEAFPLPIRLPGSARILISGT